MYNIYLGIDLCINDRFRYKKLYKTFMKLIFIYNIYLGIDLCINDRFRYKKYTQNFHKTNIYVKKFETVH